MRNLLCAIALLATVGLTGCFGYKSTTAGTEVDVRSTVIGPDGKALTGLSITFQPAEAGARPETFPLKADGSFTGKMLVGKYRYYLSGKSESDRSAEVLLSRLPESYRKAEEKRIVDVDSGGGTLTLKF